MKGLLHAARVIGVRRLRRLRRAHRVGWQGIIQGYWTTRALQVLFRCGWMDEVHQRGPVAAGEYARARGLDGEILTVLCTYLEARGILRRVHTGYVLSPKGRLLVEVARGWFEGIDGYREVHRELEALLRKEKVYGRDVVRTTHEVSRGTGEVSSWIFYPLVVDILRRAGYTRALDFGCGDASFLLYLCRHSSLDGCGIDVAGDALTAGRKRVLEAGLTDRISLRRGDMFDLDEVASSLPSFDVATAIFVLHELLYQGEDAVVAFLKDYRRLFPTVPLIVFEVILPSLEEVRRRPGMAAQYRVQHVLTHQRLAGRELWKNLFEQAGFDRIRDEYLRYARTTMFTLQPVERA